MAEGPVDPNGVCEVLAKIGRPALIVDRQGQLIAANELTAKLLGPDLHVVNGRLISADPVACTKLDALIKALTLHQATAEALAVRRKDGPPIIIHGISLPQTASGPEKRATALLVLVDLKESLLPTQAQLVEAFGLSWMEARIALKLAAGNPVQSAARSSGISYESARSLLKAAFRKTGTHRQAELVALLYQMTILRVPTVEGGQ